MQTIDLIEVRITFVNDLHITEDTMGDNTVFHATTDATEIFIYNEKNNEWNGFTISGSKMAASKNY